MASRSVLTAPPFTVRLVVAPAKRPIRMPVVPAMAFSEPELISIVPDWRSQLVLQVRLPESKIKAPPTISKAAVAFTAELVMARAPRLETRNAPEVVNGVARGTFTSASVFAEPVGAERVKPRSESAADGVAALIVTVRVPAFVIWVGSAPAELFGAEASDQFVLICHSEPAELVQLLGTAFDAWVDAAIIIKATALTRTVCGHLFISKSFADCGKQNCVCDLSLRRRRYRTKCAGFRSDSTSNRPANGKSCVATVLGDYCRSSCGIIRSVPGPKHFGQLLFCP